MQKPYFYLQVVFFLFIGRQAYGHFLLPALQLDSGQVANSPLRDASTLPVDQVGRPALDQMKSSEEIRKVPLVTEVNNLRIKERNFRDAYKAGIEDIIVVKVRGLKKLVDKSNCLESTGSTIPGCVKQEIRLFIDGRMIKDIVPESGAPQPEDGELQYHLERNIENSEAWADILGGPRFNEYFFEQPVKISVGLENEYPIDSLVEDFGLVRIRKAWFWACSIGFIIFLHFLFKLGKQSDLLRDRGTNAEIIGITRANGARAPYSLARVQMAIWFSLVVFSFLFIWLVTNAHEVSASVLVLLGIGAGTALSGTVIDNNKGESILNETIDLIAKEQVIINEIANIKVDISNTTDISGIRLLNADLNSKVSEHATLTTLISRNKDVLRPLKSINFVEDILSDYNGISFHRFQLVIWTIVLSFVFIYSVWNKLAMIDFPSELLALQGITAGTYLGFKIPERQS